MSRVSEDSPLSQYCEAIAKELQLSERDMEECRATGRGDQGEVCYQVLKWWKETTGEQATLGRLLKSIERVVDKEIYCKIAKRLLL